MGNPWDMDWDAGAAPASGVLPLVQRLETGGLKDPNNAVSPKGAIGRNQVMPATAVQYGFDPSKLTDPAYNDQVSTAVLDDLSKRFGGDQDAVLVGYNAGPGRVAKWDANDRNPAFLPVETQKYLAKAGAVDATPPALPTQQDDGAIPPWQQNWGGDQGGAKPWEKNWQPPVQDSPGVMASVGDWLHNTFAGGEKPTGAGAAVRGAARGALPAAGGLIAAGTGAELGGAGGAALGAMTGPAAPVAVPVLGAVGGIGGGLAGAFGGASAVNWMQDQVLKHLPASVLRLIGQDAAQQKADTTQHPYATFGGELAPNLLAFRPGAIAKLPEAATAIERLMANPVTARALPATIMGGTEAANEQFQDGHLDPIKIAMSAGLGALSTKETALGSKLTGLGAAPVAALARAAAAMKGVPADSAVRMEPGAATEPDQAPTGKPTVPLDVENPPITPAATALEPVHDPATWAQTGWKDAQGNILPLDAAPPPPDAGVVPEGHEPAPVPEEAQIKPGAPTPTEAAIADQPSAAAEALNREFPKVPEPAPAAAVPPATVQVTKEIAAKALETKIDPATGARPKGNAALRDFRTRMQTVLDAPEPVADAAPAESVSRETPPVVEQTQQVKHVEAPPEAAPAQPATEAPTPVPAPAPVKAAKFDPNQHYDAAIALVRDRSKPLSVPALADHLGIKPAQAQRVAGMLASRPDTGVTLSQSGNLRRKPISNAPNDVAGFLAAKGGIRDNEGHDLIKGRGLQQFVPGQGPLIRPKGMSVDYAGEALHEAGFFGPPESTPRPTEDQVLQLLEKTGRTPGGKPTKVLSDVDQANADMAREGQRAEEDNQRARDEVADHAKSLGEDFTPEDIEGVVGIMGRHDLTAEDATHEYVERLAMKTADDSAREAQDDSYADIPFDTEGETAPAQDGGAAGHGGSGRPGEQQDQSGGSAVSEAAAENRQPAEPDQRAERTAESDGSAPADASAAEPSSGPAAGTDAGPDGLDQTIVPGTARSARQLAQAREDAGKGRSTAKAPQQDAGGMFAPKLEETGDLLAAAEKPQEAAPVPEKAETTAGARTPPKVGEVLQDAGEKIGGAKKDRWAERGLRASDLEGMSEGEAYKHVTKDAVWPKPDYAKMVEGGMDPNTAAQVKLIRDRLAAKPRTDSAQGRRDYVEMMGHVRDELAGVKNKDDLAGARQRILYDRLGWNKHDLGSAESRATRDRLFSIFNGRHETLAPQYGDEGKARKLVESGFPGDIAPWRRRMEVRQSGHGFFITDKGKFRVLEKDFKTREEAEGRAATLYEDKKGTGEDAPLPERPHLDKLERTGMDIRNGKPAKPEDFVNDFGFRGVEFGNYVAGDERQKAVNLAYDGLHDLAETLGIPPEAVSLNGKLGLAFGARGSGKAAAHYEPGKLVINLTKLSGAGSLAHEWAHALDHHFGMLDRPESTKGQTRGASGWYDRVQPHAWARHLENLRPEMSEAFNGVMDKLFRKEKPRAMAVRDLELRLESAEAQKAKYEKQFDAHKARPGEEQQKSYIKQMTDYLAHNDRQIALMKNGLADLRDPGKPYNPSKMESSFFMGAKALSGKSGEKGYWARPTEMFARSFESYVFDKIKEGGNKSDYLVQGVEPGRYAEGYKGNPYPTGEERTAINGAFDKLFEEMKVRDTETGGKELYAKRAAEGWDTVDTGTPGQPTIAERAQARGKVRAEASYTPEFNAKRIEVGNALRDRLDKLGLEDIALKIPDAIKAVGENQSKEFASSADGFYSPARKLIAVALDNQHGYEHSLDHEAIHAMKDLGLFHDGEWKALERHAEGWVKKYKVDQTYASSTPAKIIEEGIAHAFPDWRAGKLGNIGGAAQRAFRKIANFFEAVGNVFRGHGFNSADSVFSKIASGEIGTREGMSGGDTEPSFARRPKDDEEPEPPQERPPGPINRLLGEHTNNFFTRVGKAVDSFMPDSLKEAGNAVQMALSPMAAKSATPEARAAAKDFANQMRKARLIGGRQVDYLAKNFDHEQLEKMWSAADQESVMRQQGQEPGPTQGLNRLTAPERAAVEAYQADSNVLLKQATDIGMFQGEGLPSYVPRMVVAVAADGKVGRIGKGEEMAHGLDAIGKNLKTTSSNLKQRKYLTVEETEKAAQALDPNAVVIKDIRTLPIAMTRLQEAIAGRTLINKIREMGRDSGEATISEGVQPGEETGHKWFTIDHPAFKTYRPQLVKNEQTGKFEMAQDQNGEPLFERVPLYVRDDFEGPLRAVLSQDQSRIYKAFMDLKGKMMSVVMYSPLMHNAVIWGKALPAAPLKLLNPMWKDADGKLHFSLELYGRGRASKNDPAVMKEALDNGMDPVGHRFFNQDLSSIMEAPDVKPGRSWTAKVLAAVPNLFDKGAGDAVKRAVDKAGDVWHNKFLWDLVGDLQMGLYTHMRDKAIKDGADPQTAGRYAAHFANRYAGALPIESMSKIARQTANMMLFSRSFTLTNLGAFKDIVAGLPRDVQAQILRDKGVDALNRIQGTARRKAISLLAMDIFLSHAGLFMAQYALAWAQGAQFHPPSENEPDKESRFLIGHQDDGTAVYGRLPTGKVGEELQDWITSPMDLSKRKLSPYGRFLYGMAANDQGFGRKVYDPYDETPEGVAKNIGRITEYAARSVLPLDAFKSVPDLMAGRGDKQTNMEKLLLPMVGITVSKGAPGGEAVGQLYASKDEHEFQVGEAMPDIRKKITDGDIAGAQADMTKLGMDRAYQKFVIRTTQNPGARLSKKQVKEFMGFATPGEKAKMQNFMDRTSTDDDEEASPGDGTTPDKHSALAPEDLKSVIANPTKLASAADNGLSWSRDEAVSAMQSAGYPATAELLRSSRVPLRPDLHQKLLGASGVG